MNDQFKNFDAEKVGVATDTWYPHPEQESDHIRSELAILTLASCQRKKYKIGLVDGSPENEQASFHRLLRTMGIPFEVQKEKGMSKGRQQSFQILYNDPDIEVFVRLEPEKVSFIGDCVPIAASPILNGEADLIIPKRTTEGFESLPIFQRATEQLANMLYNDRLHRWGLLPKDISLDLFFGPRLFNRKAYPFFMHTFQSESKAIDPGKYSNALFYPVILALRAGLQVMSVEVPYLHPIDQKIYEDKHSEDFNPKRLKQAQMILREADFLAQHLGVGDGTNYDLELIS